MSKQAKWQWAIKAIIAASIPALLGFTARVGAAMAQYEPRMAAIESRLSEIHKLELEVASLKALVSRLESSQRGP